MANEISTDVLVIGAGLTGLSAAYFLKDTGLRVIVAESRSRIGGRIHSIGVENKQSIEMGATWLGAQHKNLIELMNALGSTTFIQKMGTKAIFEPISTSPPYLASFPENSEPTMRIKGGSSSLIHKLHEQFKKEQLLLNAKITKISSQENELVASTDRHKIRAKYVISTLPPNLLLNSVSFQPQLPENLIAIGKETHTWMGESIKIALSYDQPFWRTENSAGTIISNVGPIPEMYDHSDFEESYFALMGFLNGNYYSVTKERRLELILQQLQKYYGAQVRNYNKYYETVWRKESETYAPYQTHILPHQNNGHEIYKKKFLNGRLIIAGAETSPIHSGYMDGAVYSARLAADFIKESIN